MCGSCMELWAKYENFLTWMVNRLNVQQFWRHVVPWLTSVERVVLRISVTFACRARRHFFHTRSEDGNRNLCSLFRRQVVTSFCNTMGKRSESSKNVRAEWSQTYRFCGIKKKIWEGSLSKNPNWWPLTSNRKVFDVGPVHYVPLIFQSHTDYQIKISNFNRRNIFCLNTLY